MKAPVQTYECCSEHPFAWFCFCRLTRAKYDWWLERFGRIS